MSVETDMLCEDKEVEIQEDGSFGATRNIYTYFFRPYTLLFR